MRGLAARGPPVRGPAGRELPARGLSPGAAVTSGTGAVAAGGAARRSLALGPWTGVALAARNPACSPGSHPMGYPGPDRAPALQPACTRTAGPPGRASSAPAASTPAAGTPAAGAAALGHHRTGPRPHRWRVPGRYSRRDPRSAPLGNGPDRGRHPPSGSGPVPCRRNGRPPWPCSPATLVAPLFLMATHGSVPPACTAAGRTRGSGALNRSHRNPGPHTSLTETLSPDNAVEAAPCWERPQLKMSGGVLLSHAVPRAVPSALKGLTSGFGMEPGVSPSPWPPKHYGDVRTVPARTSVPARHGTDRTSGTAQWTRNIHKECRSQATRPISTGQLHVVATLPPPAYQPSRLAGGLTRLTLRETSS